MHFNGNKYCYYSDANVSITEPPKKSSSNEDELVQSMIVSLNLYNPSWLKDRGIKISLLMTMQAHARLRKEEFERLLEEHAQICKEINRAETSSLL